jgi:hypothetical protein
MAHPQHRRPLCLSSPRLLGDFWGHFFSASAVRHTTDSTWETFSLLPTRPTPHSTANQNGLHTQLVLSKIKNPPDGPHSHLILTRPLLFAVCHAEVKPGCEEKMKAKLIEAAAIYKKDKETIDW